MNLYTQVQISVSWKCRKIRRHDLRAKSCLLSQGNHNGTGSNFCWDVYKTHQCHLHKWKAEERISIFLSLGPARNWSHRKMIPLKLEKEWDTENNWKWSQKWASWIIKGGLQLKQFKKEGPGKPKDKGDKNKDTRRN